MSSKQATLVDFGPDLSELTEAEREAYVACRENDVGVREFDRQTERRSRTIGNLLARAGVKLEEVEERLDALGDDDKTIAEYIVESHEAIEGRIDVLEDELDGVDATAFRDREELEERPDRAERDIDIVDGGL